MDSGFQSSVGFRIPWAVFRITNARISDSISKIFTDSGIPRKRYNFRDGDDRSTGCGILAKKMRECGIRTPLPSSMTVESKFRVVSIAQGSNKGPLHCEKSTVEQILWMNWPMFTARDSENKSIRADQPYPWKVSAQYVDFCISS